MRSLRECGEPDDPDERADRESPQSDRPAPGPDRIRRVQQQLAEPLIRQDRSSRDGPRVEVDTRDAVGGDVATDREMPEEVAVRDGRARGGEGREPGEN